MKTISIEETDENMKVIEVHQSVYAINDAIAEETRRQLKEDKTFILSLIKRK